MLRVKLLNGSAKPPTVAHPGEDLGYDIYAAYMVVIAPRSHAIVPTGIAIECTSSTGEPMGALLRDKSSMAARRVMLTGGVIDAGYRGEIKVLMENLGESPQVINAGDKIANLIPYPVLTAEVQVVDDLRESSRKAGGFGSTGK
ncbi:MAG TPA: dUTP diphosphatase [Candidatus Angelobacter sp.]|nr:dUTP diphosphatase [Candidatus Angelobacter sp.]